MQVQPLAQGEAVVPNRGLGHIIKEAEMARRRRSLAGVKVCRVVRGKVKCKSMGAKRRKSRAMGAMPRRNSKGRFMKG